MFVALCRVVMAGFLGLTLVSTPAPARAQEANLKHAIEAGLRRYGWKPEAIAYLVAHSNVHAPPSGADNACPWDVACTLSDGTIYLNQVPQDPAAFAYVVNHESIHEIEFARGSGEAGVGTLLADLLSLSKDGEHLLAASAARRVLGLTGRHDFGVLETSDWFHMEHDVLEGVGWDVGALPGWYRDAYFPYLNPNPPAALKLAVSDWGDPPDLPWRLERVMDSVARMCGPVLPGATVRGPSIDCSARPDAWLDVIYGPMPGAAGRRPPASAGLQVAAPARPVAPLQVATVPLPQVAPLEVVSAPVPQAASTSASEPGASQPSTPGSVAESHDSADSDCDDLDDDDDDYD